MLTLNTVNSYGSIWVRVKLYTCTLVTVKSCHSYLLQKILQQPGELVHQLVQELGAGYIYPVKDCELFVAESMVSLRAGLQDFCVCVLLHNFFYLTQQSIQMLDRRGKIKQNKQKRKQIMCLLLMQKEIKPLIIIMSNKLIQFAMGSVL